MSWTTKAVKYISEKVYKYFGNGSGKMLLATSMIGISMSSVIQALAVMFNDKYTSSQKAFMIPQELSDAVLSIVSIFAISKPTQNITSKLVKSGKILPQKLVDYMDKNNFAHMRGKNNFDFRDKVTEIINNIEKSDKFITKSEREAKIASHKKILNEYDYFQDSASAFATTAASLASTCLVVPIIRNNSASKFQKKNIEYFEQPKTIKISPFKV